MGMGRTQVGGVYCLTYSLRCSPSLKSRLPTVLSLGSMIPTAANIFPMERRYCSTIFFWILCPLAVRDPVRTHSKKIWRYGTGYLITGRSYGIHIHVQNESHCLQAVESFRRVEAHSPVATAFFEEL